MCFPKGLAFFILPVKKRRESATGGDKAEAGTPTSRQLYIYTSATQHPGNRESTKNFFIHFLPKAGGMP